VSEIEVSQIEMHEPADKCRFPQNSLTEPTQNSLKFSAEVCVAFNLRFLRETVLVRQIFGQSGIGGVCNWQPSHLFLDLYNNLSPPYATPKIPVSHAD
jgi:hypothetical protein